MKAHMTLCQGCHFMRRDFRWHARYCDSCVEKALNAPVRRS